MKKVLSLIVAIILVLGVSGTASAKKVKTHKIGLNCVENIKIKWNGKRTFNFKVENKKIVKKLSTPQFNELYDGDYCYAPFKGLKQGTTKVKVYQKKKLVNTLTIKVVKKTPKMPKKNYKMKFSNKGLTKNSTLLAVNKYSGKMKFYNFKAKYKLKSSNSKVATVKDGVVKTAGVGKATISVFETLNKKTKKVCSFKVTVSAVKMNAVAKYNREFYDDGLFGKGEFVEYLYLNPDEGSSTLDMRQVIVGGLLNNLDASFTPDDYTISYVSADPEIVSVDDKGLATAQKAGSTEITYKITFADGSEFSESVDFMVE